MLLRAAAAVLTLVACGAALAWAAGGAWWALDLANHFAPAWVGATALGAALAWRVDRRWGGALALLAAAQGARLVPTGGRGPDGGRPVTVLLANVLSSNPDRDALLALVRAEDPDLIGLLEVTPGWLADLGALRAGWPDHLEVPRDDNFGLALYCRGCAGLRVEALGDGRVPSIVGDWGGTRVVLTHPVPPISAAATRSRDAQLADLPPPGDAWVVLGDLNATPWSAGFPRVVVRAWPTGTWPAGAPLRIPIDHLLAGPAVGLDARRVGPPIGSDHLPVVGELRLP